MKSFKGYISSRKVDWQLVPQRVQNLVIRNYCEKKELRLEMSAAEYKIENSFAVLESLVEVASHYEGFIFYSVFQLPQDTKIRHELLIKLLAADRKIHFSLEELVISANDFKVLDSVFMASELSAGSENILSALL